MPARQKCCRAALPVSQRTLGDLFMYFTARRHGSSQRPCWGNVLHSMHFVVQTADTISSKAKARNKQTDLPIKKNPTQKKRSC